MLEAGPVGRLLDVGTGSGVLAIAAARLGVPWVGALDLDPDAVAATISNASRNGVAERVHATLGTPETWSAPPAELVLANLLGSALVALATPLARCCAMPGRLIAGGLLVHEVPTVVASYVPEGFRLVELTEREGWVTLLLARGT
jgi:ribosomal protein L11 methyltransferase